MADSRKSAAPGRGTRGAREDHLDERSPTILSRKAALELTSDQKAALDAARHLAEHGVPLFVAKPLPGGKFRLPDDWQLTEPDPSVVDTWVPGMALCAVTGHTIDVVDVDPRSGGSLASLEEVMPVVYGEAETPSGGTHHLIAALGERKFTLPGIDVQAGDSDGEGRGFVFIAPTVRASKVDGVSRAYAWTQPPDLGPLLIDEDTSGAALAAMRPVTTTGPEYTGPEYARLAPEQQREADAEVSRVASWWREHLQGVEDWPEGQTDDQGRGWELLARDLAWSIAQLVAAPWTTLDEDEGRTLHDELLPAALAGDDKCAGKWERALGRAHGGLPPWDKRDSPEDDFEPFEASRAEEPDAFEREVAIELQRLRVRRTAQDRLRAEEVGSTPPPPPVSAREFLAHFEDETPLVESLIPRQGKFLIAAAAKAGKTTTVHHVIASLLSGRPMFGAFHVDVDQPLRVHLIDNEMGDELLRTWLRRLDLTLEEQDRLTVHSLLGYASTFDPTTPESRAIWAERLEGADVVIVDCLSPFIQAIGLDENHDAGRWLVGLDELMAAAGVEVYGVAHHTGHAGERARGDSKILGWPFQTWTLNREAPSEDDDAEDNAPRFLKARGRCGSLASGQLVLSSDGLQYVAGVSRAKARAAAKHDELLDEILEAAPEGVEHFGAGVAAGWVGIDPRTARKALDRGVSIGRLTKQLNPNGSGHVFAEVRGGEHGQ